MPSPVTICLLTLLLLPTACRGNGPGSGVSETSDGWTVTVYYTAVATLHHGRLIKVTGCPQLDCVNGRDDLGTHPEDFVDAVRNEGTGRTADGRYLNWSHDTGYWLDTAPRDTAGRALVPFSSAAADPAVMRAGTEFHIVHCGRESGGGRVDDAVCERLRQAHWTITDEFTPGLGGAKHIDVYIGEESGPDFTQSEWYTTLTNATLAIGS